MARPSTGVAIVVELALGDGRLELVLSPDPAHRTRALAHGGGHALHYRSRWLPDELRGPLERMATALAAQRGAVGSATVIDLLRLAAEAAGATLRERRVEAPSQLLPRWPQFVRIGVSQPPAIWPFDHELIALNARLRTLLKRDVLLPDEEARDRSWLESQGLRIRREGNTLFAARDSAILETAADAERRFAAGAVDAQRWLGEALGYPRCCIDAFVSLRSQDDLTLARERLDPLPSAPAPVETQWLIAPLAPFSHIPCSLRCEATRQLARGVIAAAEPLAPGRERLWRRLTARLHAIDVSGVPWSIDLEGDPSHGTVIRADAWRLSGTNVPRLEEVPALAGRSIEIAASALRFGSVTAFIVADHRG